MNGATKQKAMAALVPLLAIALIFVALKVFGSPSVKTAKARRSEPANKVGDSNYRIDWQPPAPYPATLRDPMQSSSLSTVEVEKGPQEAGTQDMTELIVRGIVYSKDDPVAVVGTQIVHEGNIVSGATVLRIEKDRVEFEMNGKRWTQSVQCDKEAASKVSEPEKESREVLQ